MKTNQSASLGARINARVTDSPPSFSKTETVDLPSFLPLPEAASKDSTQKTANGRLFATRQLALENALRDFDRTPRRFASVNSELDRLNPFDRLVCYDNRVLLIALLRALNQNHRQVILWHYYGGLTRRQIAAKLNRSVALVSLRLRQGREKLRRLLNCDCERHWLRREFREQFPPLEKES